MIEPIDLVTGSWVLAHVLLYFAGKWWVRTGFLGRWGPKLQVAFQVASWVCGLFFVTLFLWPSRPLWLSDPVVQWVWIASGPFCCFFAGFSYTMEKKPEKLLPLTYVVIVVVIVALLYVILGYLRVGGFIGGPKVDILYSL